MEQLYLVKYQHGGMEVFDEDTVVAGVHSAGETIYKISDLIEVTLTTAFVPVKKEIVHRKHKKHNHMKECDLCGGKFKGVMGLSIHRSTIHGIRGPHYEENHKTAE